MQREVRRVVRRSLGVAFAFCLASGSLHARDWFADRRIGTGVELVHQDGMAAMSLTLSPAELLVWSQNSGVGLTYRFGRERGWNAGLGGIVVRRTDEDLGTRLNFLLRASYCAKELCLSFAHISHGGGIGIYDDKANSGLNFLFLEYRYR